MKTYAVLAAIAAVSIAAPAGAAVRHDAQPVARVSLKGKSAQQIQADIRLAARNVCKTANPASHNDYRACVGSTIRAAKADLQAMIASGEGNA